MSVYRFDSETGKVTLLSQVEGSLNPDFLALSNDNKFVYACNVGVKTSVEGEVSAFKFDKATGKLTLINKVPGRGNNPVHISIDKENKNVLVSYYSSGSVSVFPIKADGSLDTISQRIVYTGAGPHRNQKGPHVHMTKFSDDGKTVLVADLGTDRVLLYNYDNTKAQPLTPADPAVELMSPADGPRHMEFSPNEKFLYVIQELSASLRVYKYDKGKLAFVQMTNMMPEGYDKNGAADLHISPDGNFLYASVRGDADKVILYAINKQNGKLTYVDQYSVSKAPRGFTIDPTGSFLISAGRDGNTIDFFKIDKPTGKLTKTDTKIDLAQVTCLKWVVVD
ncbi:lactonase family protein [Mucilaginibacter sp. S1162]|uniref:Lactonase family protein n=1 Tax=Mucilaginibacter humi TaxID=2732510 RepID=A0ABX1W267_9SPHI|nr:lactonase family protein [Mucilaginibacter humi]